MKANIQRDDGVPLHHHLSAILRSNILSGQYPYGTSLPGELHLMAQYQVSRATVRRALHTIEQEGLIERRQGKGTTVCHETAKARAQTGNTVDSRERVYKGTRVQLLEHGAVMARDDVAAALGIDEGSQVYRVARLRWLADKPLWYLVNFLPLPIAEQLSPRAFESASLIAALGRAGHRIAYADDTVGAILCDPIMARLLKLNVGGPLVEVSRTLVDTDGRNIAVQKTVFSPTRHRLQIRVDMSTPLQQQPLREAGAYVDFMSR